MKIQLNPDTIKFTFIPNIWSTDLRVITMSQYLEAVNYYRGRVLDYREVGDPAMKKAMPAIISGARFKDLSKGRDRNNISYLTSYATFDVDYVEDVEGTKKKLSEIPYVFFIMKSVSGKGVWGMVAFKNPSFWYWHFNALIKDMQSRGIVLDPLSDPNRLRFFSYDEEYIWKPEVEIFDKISHEGVNVSKRGNDNSVQRDYGQDFSKYEWYLIGKFNSENNAEDILEEAGWIVNGEDRRGRVQMLRPGGDSTHANSGNIQDNKFWCWTSSDRHLESGCLYTPFDLLVRIKYRGKAKKAIRSLVDATDRRKRIFNVVK